MHNDHQMPDERRGRITASQIHKLFTATGSIANNDTARNYIRSLAMEDFFGLHESADAWQLAHGHYAEPLAVQAYEQLTGRNVDQLQFITIGEYLGATPDGVDSEDVLLDFKAPVSLQNWALQAMKPISSDYWHQLQMGMVATKTEKARLCFYLTETERMTDYDKYYPVPEDNRLIILELEKDEGLYEHCRVPGAETYEDVLNTITATFMMEKDNFMDILAQSFPEIAASN